MKKFLLSVSMLAAVITACVLTSCQDQDLDDVVAPATPVTSYTVPVATAAQAAALPSGMAYQYQVNGQTVSAEDYQKAAANITSDTNFTIAVVDTATGTVVSSSSFVLKPMTADQAEAGQVPPIVNNVNGTTTSGYSIVIPTVTTNPTTGETTASAGEAVETVVSYDGDKVEPVHGGGGGKN